MEGVIFDIQPFSLHDGPGIRTTVFLKGCPLRCQWCCNPESFTGESILSHHQQRCINCLDCVQVCPSGALSVVDNSLQVQHEHCTMCGSCVEVCLQDALRLYGYKEKASNIVQRVLRDKAYYDKSGGGITLSGGEPMLQAGFSLELLKQSKEADLHTCLETCGFATEKQYESVLPFLDLILFDYKATHMEHHRLLTGQSNDQILRNLHFLNRQHAQLVLRCPLIPGLNDTSDHLNAIATLSNSLEGIVEVELLPYHNYGLHKYRQIGLTPPALGESAHISCLREWETQLTDLGCRKLKTFHSHD